MNRRPRRERYDVRTGQSSSRADDHRVGRRVPGHLPGAGRREGRQPRLQAGCEVAHGVGAGHAPGDRRHLVPRQHHQRRVRVESRRREAGRVAVQDRRRRRRVLQEDVPREAQGAARAAGREADADDRLLRHDEAGRLCSSSASPTTTASTTAVSSPPTCARWARRCRTSTARSADDADDRRRSRTVP